MMVFKYDISDIAAQDMECFRDMTAYVSSYIISIDKTETAKCISTSLTVMLMRSGENSIS